MQNTSEIFLFHVGFLAGEWNVLAGSYCSTIVKQGSMQDGGGQEYGERFEIPAGREIWFQNRVVSQFSESQKFVLCNEGGGREGIREKGRRFAPKWKEAWERAF